MTTRAALRSNRNGQVKWTLNGMEPRLMLAADAGVVVDAVAAEVAQPASDSQQRTVSTNIVFIDQSLEDVDVLKAAVSAESEVVLLDDRDAISQITEVLRTRSEVQQISLVSHGSDGQLLIGDSTIDQELIESRAQEIRTWQNALAPDADLLIFGCNVAAGTAGQSFVGQLSRLTGADIAASIDVTGNVSDGADWELEFALGHVDNANVFCNAKVRRFQHTLDVVVHAWGTTGDERIDLLIDDTVVATYDLETTHQGFYYQTDEAISADRVKVRFTNDSYNPAQNYDRNAYVESIQIDGVFYESEDVATRSTGTYRAQDGLRTGFGRGEVLHANGFFEYGTNLPSGGSQLEIVARGQTGEERFSLSIGNDLIGDFDAATHDQTFVYQTQAPIDAADVRITFLNDVYVPGGQDNNLIVDKIRIDGVEFETEAASVFSTGTWTQQDGVVPGFRHSEILHTNGYFQYGVDPQGATSIVSDPSFGDNGVIEFSESTRLLVATSSVSGTSTFAVDGNQITSLRVDFQVNTFFGDNGVATIPQDDVAVLDIVVLPRGGFVVLTRDRLTLDNFQLHQLSETGDYVRSVAVDDLGAGPLTTFGLGPKLGETAGSVILAGNKQNSDVTAFFALNSDLSPQTSFGNNGIAEHAGITGTFANVSEIVTTSDGGFLTYAANQDTQNPDRGLVLHKFDGLGQVDESFGNNGISEAITFTNFASRIVDIQIDLQGRIVGYSPNGYFRWTENGFLDDSFGGDGEIEVQLPPVDLGNNTSATLRSGPFGLDEDGNLIVSQSVLRSNISTPSTELGVLYGRVFADGSSDTGVGAVFFDAASGQAVGGSILVQDATTFVVVGGLSGGSFSIDPAIGQFLIV